MISFSHSFISIASFGAKRNDKRRRMLASCFSSILLCRLSHVLAFSPIKPTSSNFRSVTIYNSRWLPHPSLHSIKQHQCKISLQTVRSMGISSNDFQKSPTFRRGDKIQVEVERFGHLGASVNVIAQNSHNEVDLIPESDPPLAFGLVLQSEIQFFREKRDGVDVVIGEILPAYVEKVREEDGKLNISFRIPGGKGKAEDLAKILLKKLESNDGVLNVGDKSTPDEINREFPGTSKVAFKRAVSSLYKKGLVRPSPNSIILL